MDRRNHAETPRHSTPLKLSHVQSRSFCTWEPVHWKPTFQEEPRNRGENPESVHGVRLSNVQHPCDQPEKNPAAPIIGLGDVAAGGVGAEPAPLFAETCTVEPVQDPGVNTPGEGDGGNILNRVVVVPSFVVALAEGVGHPLGVVLGVDGRDRFDEERLNTRVVQVIGVHLVGELEEYTHQCRLGVDHVSLIFGDTTIAAW